MKMTSDLAEQTNAEGVFRNQDPAVSPRTIN